MADRRSGPYTEGDNLKPSGDRFRSTVRTGTSWYSDPQEDLVAILLTQRMAFPTSSVVYLDFWTCVYQAIDDLGNAS